MHFHKSFIRIPKTIDSLPLTSLHPAKKFRQIDSRKRAAPANLEYLVAAWAALSKTNRKFDNKSASHH